MRSSFRSSSGSTLLEILLASCLGFIILTGALSHYQLILSLQVRQEALYNLLDRARLFQIKIACAVAEIDLLQESPVQVIPAKQVFAAPSLPLALKQRHKANTAVLCIQQQCLFIGYNGRKDAQGLAISSLYTTKTTEPIHSQDLVEGLDDWNLSLGCLENKNIAWYEPENLSSSSAVRLLAINTNFSTIETFAASQWNEWNYRFKLAHGL